MRAILIAGVMLAAGSAAAQERKPTAVAAVAAVAAGASWCKFDVQSAAVEKTLADSGFDRSKVGDARSLDQAFDTERAHWQIYGQAAAMTEEGKPMLAARCAQLLDAYGPAGAIRRGLLARK